MTREWPSREEWQAKAEYAVRTACTKYERLDRAQPDAVWYSLAEDQEYETLAFAAAGTIRTLLTAEIRELRLLLPDRPTAASQRGKWAIPLTGEAYETAVNLGALEQMRAEVHRARAAEHWGQVCWELGRLRQNYPAVALPDELVKAHDRMLILQGQAEKRREEAANAIQQAAIEREIARRATDDAWHKELEWRKRVESPRIIRHSV